MDNKKLCEVAASCWFLTGATASGKTSVSLEMAKRLDAEIISLDSMAIYRGMDIGTAKPNAEVRANVAHHLIDIAEPTEPFSVSQYRELAIQTINEIRGRGREVLFVGGTALYLKALLRGMFEGPPADWDFRKEIEAELDEMGADFLHQRLAMIDPVAAHNLHPNDHRRIIRALEVFKQTGKPISHWQMQFDEGRTAEECKVFTLRHPRPTLHQRIERRVEDMFANGLIDEVRTLLENHEALGRTAAQAVGYREVIDYIKQQNNSLVATSSENSESTSAVIPDSEELQQTIELVKIRTRKFARHQETWFRGLSECRLIDLDESFEPTTVAKSLIDIGRSEN